MSKFCTSLTFFLGACSIICADASMDEDQDVMPVFPIIEMPSQDTPHSPAVENKTSSKKASGKIPEISVNPFTGKIKGRKVRVRLRPDIDSRIIKELSKNELVTVVGERGDFWAVEPPAGTKAYVFRSFVLDNVVEGSRLNVRLEPSLEAPVISHLVAGDKIEKSNISPINPKWLEINPPANTRFYIAKEYIDYAGGPEVKIEMDRKQSAAEQLLDATSLISKAELRKSIEEMDFDRIVKGYNTVITDFTEFPDLVEHAKEALASFQEAYLQKRITYLEAQATQAQESKEQQPLSDTEKCAHLDTTFAVTDRMKLWEPVEEALFLSWARINDHKTQNEYYEEQKLAAIEIEGIVEPYAIPAKSKPGDFILQSGNVPVGYLYSTTVNLQSLSGKKVKLLATPRPNNSFAFPAYYVLSVE